MITEAHVCVRELTHRAALHDDAQGRHGVVSVQDDWPQQERTGRERPCATHREGSEQLHS